MRDGEKPQLALRPLLEPFAGQPSGSHGDARLNLLIAGALGILGGAEKRRDAAFLVVLEREPPHDGRREEETEKQEAENAEPHAGQIGDRQEHRHQRHGRAEVGFLRDERERDAGQGTTDGEIGPGRRPPILAEELGEDQRDADLGELGRLQVEEPQANPAPGPHLHGAEEHDVDEEREQADVNEMGFVGERPVVERQHEPHGRQPDDNGIELRGVQV